MSGIAAAASEFLLEVRAIMAFGGVPSAGRHRCPHPAGQWRTNLGPGSTYTLVIMSHIHRFWGIVAKVSLFAVDDLATTMEASSPALSRSGGRRLQRTTDDVEPDPGRAVRTLDGDGDRSRAQQRGYAPPATMPFLNGSAG